MTTRPVDRHLAVGDEEQAKVVDIPWQTAVGGDLSIDSVPGHRPLPMRIVNAYVARILRAAPRDAVVSAAFQSVVHMVKAPPSLFAPRVLWRVLLKGGQGRPTLRPLPAQPLVVTRRTPPSAC